MTPFTFATDQAARGEWTRFNTEAARWKPSGFDAEMSLRLAYYLDQQIVDLRATLKAKFPETHLAMTPITVPLVRHFIREQAKVFLAQTKLDLSQGTGEVSPDILAWWEDAQQEMGLGLRLKKVDTYTTLFRAAGLFIASAGGKLTARVVFPQNVHVVLDPSAPNDLDLAYGVAMEIASEGGVESGGPRRFEFWCARPGAEQHVILEVGSIVDESGSATVRVVEVDKGDPLRGPDGRAIVPIVLFTAHTEELGLFTLEGSDLVPANRALNVLATDLHFIAEQQGFGVLVLTAPAGEEAPAKIVRSPNTAISLRGGVTASFINPNAPLADLIQLFDTRLKQEAVLKGIPAGAVSIEARAVSSGVALQIENRPLHELRSDAIELYRSPMRRMWSVIWAVHNAYTEERALSTDLQMRWTPGDIQVPTDEQARIDNALAKMKSRLQSRAETIAELRGVSLEEAKKIADTIDTEEPAAVAGDELDASLLPLDGKRAALKGGAPADGAPPAEPPKSTPAAAALDGVVQDTALNGAQVSSLLEIATAVVNGELPITTAEAMIRAAFPALPAELVTRIIAGLKGFEPPAAPAPAPFPPAPAG
jgi:hypothetical protein